MAWTTRTRNWNFVDAWREGQADRCLFSVSTQRNTTAFPGDADAPKWDGWCCNYDGNLTSLASMNTIQTAAEGADRWLMLRTIGGQRTGLTGVYDSIEGTNVVPDFMAKAWWDWYEGICDTVANNLGDCDNFVCWVPPSMFAWTEHLFVDETLWADVTTGAGGGAVLYGFDAEWVEAQVGRQVELALARLPAHVQIQVDTNPLRTATGSNHRTPNLDALIDIDPVRVRLGQDSIRTTEDDPVTSFGGQVQAYADLYRNLSGLVDRGRIVGWSGELATRTNTNAWGGSNATGDKYVLAIDRAISRGARHIELFDGAAGTPWTDATIKAAYGRA